MASTSRQTRPRSVAVALPRPAGEWAPAAGARGGALGRWCARQRASGRADWAIAVALFAVALAVYLPRLGVPEYYLFDEPFFAYTAGEYLKGNEDAWSWEAPCRMGGDIPRCVEGNPSAADNPHMAFFDDRITMYEWVHPPLSRHLMAAGILLFGDNAVGWRIVSAVFGAIGIVLAYRLGLVVTGRRAVALLAAALLLVDGMWFVQSRRGLPDLLLAVFILCALVAFGCYLAAPPDHAWRPLLATGALLGLAIAVKWSAVYPSVLLGLVVLWRIGRLGRAARRGDAERTAARGLRQHLVWAPIALCAVPLAEYLLVHLPFFLHGHGPGDFVELQVQRFAFHRHLEQTHDYASRWWQWPLALRPVWHGSFTSAQGAIQTEYANGNPFLYWAFLPAALWVARRWWREGRTAALVVLLIVFLGQWLPWMLVPRMTFAYHFLPAVPFGCLAVATAVVDVCREHAGWRRTLAVEYVVLVVAAFAFFYPLYAYAPVSPHGLELRLWLSSWR